MKAIARSTVNALRAHPTEGGALTAELSATIDSHVSFIDHTGSLAVAISDGDGRLLHASPGFGSGPGPGLDGMRHDELTVRSVKVAPVAGTPSEKLDDLLSEWRLVFCHRDGSFTVIVENRRSYELGEKLVQGLLVTLLLALVAALPVGYLLTRRTTGVIGEIGSTVAAVQRGDLRARIHAKSSDDELGALVEALNETFTDLEESFARVQQFSADAAHELNTPLTALRGSLEVCLRHERTNDEYRQVLAESIADIASLSALVKDLLLLAAPGGDRRSDHFQPVQMAGAIRRALDQLEGVAMRRSIVLDTQLEGSVEINGDAILLGRMCYNLVHNAIHFSPEEAIVHVRLTTRGAEAVLEVEDQGVGIGSEHQARIFDRFYQADPSRSRGTGLGLAIAEWVAELHAGSIEVESNVGVGSSFRVHLPCVVTTHTHPDPALSRDTGANAPEPA